MPEQRINYMSAILINNLTIPIKQIIRIEDIDKISSKVVLADGKYIISRISANDILQNMNKVCGSNNFALLVKNNINCLLNLNYLKNMELMRLYYQDSFNYFGQIKDKS